MIKNLAAVRAAHRDLLNEHDRAVMELLAEAGRHAQHHVKTSSKFRRRSTRSVKDATKFRVVRSKGGKLVKITSSKMRQGYNVSRGLEFGTRPHTITAKGGALSFNVGGQQLFRRSVQHPGTRPYRFLFRATNAAFRFGGPRLDKSLSRVAKRFSSRRR